MLSLLATEDLLEFPISKLSLGSCTLQYPMDRRQRGSNVGVWKEIRFILTPLCVRFKNCVLEVSCWCAWVVDKLNVDLKQRILEHGGD